jgi:hypothetical protein
VTKSPSSSISLTVRSKALGSQSFTFQEPLPDWLGGGSQVGLLRKLAHGEGVEAGDYLQALSQREGFAPLERGVLGLVLPSSDPAIADFSSYFGQVPSWALGDGGPVDGDDQAHRDRAQLALWSLWLAESHQISLPSSWLRQAGAAARYLLCRFSGQRLALGDEWSRWASLAHYLDPKLLEGLPVAVDACDDVWRGFRRFSRGESDASRWTAVAFRDAGLCVLAGAGAFAVGAPWGCELSDGRRVLASLPLKGAPPWRLESARSAPDRAGFRLLRGEGERLMVTGRHGRILVISEKMGFKHQLDLAVSTELDDMGPRRLGANGMRLELDRTAAWASTAQLWTGRKGGESSPVRLRLALSGGS